jgi:hypothetical protein
MRRAVDEDDPLALEDLVDDAKIPAPCGVKALKLTAERLPGPIRVDGDRVEDRGEDRGACLLG